MNETSNARNRKQNLADLGKVSSAPLPIRKVRSQSRVLAFNKAHLGSGRAQVRQGLGLSKNVATSALARLTIAEELRQKRVSTLKGHGRTFEYYIGKLK